MAHPERLIVGHPFNPVYLLPLVEVCPGDGAAPEAIERAIAVYRAVGMAPLRLQREIDGFIADRLLEALWLVRGIRCRGPKLEHERGLPDPRTIVPTSWGGMPPQEVCVLGRIRLRSGSWE